MLLDFVLIFISFAILFGGAELFVRGSSSLALNLGIPAIIVGLTFVSYGTSAPELLTAVIAATDGKGDLVAGNIIGSNIFAVTLILGVASLLCPMKITSQLVKVDTPLMILVVVLCVALFLDFELTRLEAGILILYSVLYTLLNIQMGRAGDPSVDEPRPRRRKRYIFLDILFILLGLGLLLGGGRLLVDEAVKIAHALEVTEAVIGLTVIGIGTSLPELAVTVVASLRKQADIAIGNVIGSVILNLAILGVCGLIQPFSALNITPWDTGVMLVSSCLLLPFFWHRLKLDRWEGGVLFGLYLIYLAHLWPKG